MPVKFAKLQMIGHDRKVTMEMDFEFLCQLRYALLLALKERGTLNSMQFRTAEESLRRQRRDRERKWTDRGIGS